MTPNELRSYPLFQECLEALEVPLLSEQESNDLSLLFTHMVPMTKWGKVDWDKIDSKVFVGGDPELIVLALEKLLKQPIDKVVFIEWSTYGIPVIKAHLDMIIRFFDDVISVSFEKVITHRRCRWLTGCEHPQGVPRLASPFYKLFTILI